MKRLLLLCAFAGLAPAQTTSVPVTFTVPNPVIADLFTYSHTQFFDPGSPTTILTAAPVGTGDTTITLNVTAGVPSKGAVLIDGEVLPYTGVSAGQLTGVTHAAQQTIAAAHASGVPVHILKYPALGDLIKALVGRDVAGIIQGLGAQSAVIGTQLAVQQAAAAAVSNAAAPGTVVQ